MSKTALITGITGQDGHHLTRFLLEKDYKVIGMVNGQHNDREAHFRNMFPKVQLEYGDLTDFSSILRIIEATEPQEIYNLGAISFVKFSFSQPELTANTTGLGVLRVLEAVKTLRLQDKVRIYQASSSEMYGMVRATPQNEMTPFHPRSPYGVAKAFAHHICVNYRESYNMHISCGILFNHEGEFRGYEFVTRKITSSVARIKLGRQEKIRLGLLTPSRDWGYAGDYVEAMWLMLQAEVPDDYVIATGKTYTVQDFLVQALIAADLDPDFRNVVEFDPSAVRPAEVESLIGDATKANSLLGWEPRTSFYELVRLMVNNDLRIERAKSG